MLYYILFVWWVMIFWIYPRSLKPSMGRFVKYFMQNHFHRFPRDFQVDYSIHTQEIDSVKRPVKWEKKKFSRKFFESTNKQTTNLLLSTSIFVIRRAPPQVVAPHFNAKMPSNPIIWLIEQPPAPLVQNLFDEKVQTKYDEQIDTVRLG